MVKQIGSMAELEAAFQSAGNRAVFVDFFATWCGPCMNIAPKLEELSKVYTNVIVLKVDVDVCEDIAAKYAISAMPTFKVFKRGQEVDTFCGANVEKVQGLLQKYN
jgi:thioredoxin 1